IRPGSHGGATIENGARVETPIAGRVRRCELPRWLRNGHRSHPGPGGHRAQRSERRVMRVRNAALLAASVVATGVAASVASAASGPPPLPTGVGGAKVTLFASGLHTPTSFAFGGGNVFEGDGGVESNTAPPNGGVFVLKGGTATPIPNSPQFVAGLAWH